MQEIACNYCQSQDTELVNEGPDLLLNKPGLFRLVRCRRCGLIYQNPQLSQAELMAHYPDDYLPYQRDDYSYLQDHALTRLCQRVIDRHPQKGILLDVGCATGSFLKGMKAQGWEVAGVELSPFAAEQARASGLDVHTGTLESAAYPADSFDVVTLWDVLEHVTDPKQTLAEIARILRPGGLLVTSLPNPTSFEARLFGGSWLGWERPRHLFLFTPALIEAYLQNAGLQMTGIESFNGRLRLTLYSLEFYCKARQIPETRWRPWLRLAYTLPFRVLTWPVYRLLEWANKSTVMTVFAQRPFLHTSEV